MANPNPFLRSPTDDLIDDLTAQAAQPVKLPEAPKATPTPKAEAAPPAAASTSDTSKPGRAPRWLPSSDLMPIFESAAQQYNVPVNVVMALAHQESRYNPNAVGQQTEWGRAKGIMQYLDDTAKGLGINPFDPAQAIPAAAKQIRERLDKGYSMDDAVKEHFAGPDRKKWGDKTAAYGREVMEKVGSIGDALSMAPVEASSTTEASHPAQVDLSQFQKDLDGEEAGRYKVLTDDYAATHFSPALMDRGAYEQTFRANNPGASDAAVNYAMGEYDKQAAQRAAAPTVENRFKTLRDPNAMFDKRLNEKLAGRGVGVVPALPDVQAATAQPSAPYTPAFDAAKAEEEGGFSAGASYLGRSLQSGLYDLAGAGAKILDEINPWTLSPGDAAVLFKDDPAKLKQFQDDSAAMVLSRFANAMSKNAEESQAAMSDRAKRDYGGLEYATLDQDKAAYRSPVKVIGDAVRSLPTTVAMAVSVYLTRGAALQAEKNALAAGLTEEAARRAAVEAGAKVMAGAGAATEGATGYAQQANQSAYEASKLSMADMAKSPKFQQLVQNEGYSPEAARAKIIADTGEEAGQIAGVVDAAVNKVGGEFLGKILTEGGKLIPRIMKGAANESATEFVQSAGEKVGENLAVQQNTNPNQRLMQGVGEAAVAGAAVGGLMGGVAAGAGGAGHATSADAQPNAQPATPKVAPPTQVQPVPAAAAPAPKSATPLTASLENTAEQPQRVIATTPDGQVAAGTIQSYREDGDGNFIARIVGDDGQVYTVTDEDGVQLTPVASPQGPLTSSLETAAEQAPAAEPQAASGVPVATGEGAPSAPVAEQPVAPPVEAAPAPFVPTAAAEPTTPADMTDDQLRKRMQYLAGQFRGAVDRGVQKKIALERRAIEKEINARAKVAEQTAKGASDVSVEQPVAPGGNQAPASVAPVEQARAAPAAQLDAAQNLPPAGRPAPGVGEGVVAVGGPAVADAALKDEHAKKWFGSEVKAKEYIAKRKLGQSHQVIQTGKVRYEVRPKDFIAPPAEAAAEALVAKPDKLAAADAKHARQEELVRQAMEKAAARQAEKAAAAAPQTELDTAAHEAATSPTNDLPEPTAAQKDAGNYKKGHIQVHGMDITVENPRGSTRSGQRPDGSTWSHEMSDHYGYIKRTEGADGEQIDVYIGQKPESDRVFVVDQLNQNDGSFDEHKAMLGYGNKQAALRAYKSNFDKGWKVGPVRQMSVDEFKAWIKEGDTTRPAAEHQTEADPTIQGERNGIDQRTEQQPNGAEEAPGRQKARKASASQEASKAPVLTKPRRKKAAAEPEMAEAEPRFSVSGDADITDTPAFKRWFGDSKVVDAKGKPLVVYHGSPDLRFMSEDGTFKSQREKLGFGRADAAHWFAASPATARSYADPRRAFDYQNAEEGVIPVYLKMENPLIVDGKGQKWRDAQKSGKTSDVIKEARDGGYDGVIIRNVKDDYQTGVVKGERPTDTYVVWGSKQIKSADRNSGDFNPENPDIRFSTQDGEAVASAIARLMADKSGEAVANIPGVGEVTIPYGDSKSGLAHIARRRGENFIPRVIDLLTHGKVYEKEGQKGRVFLGHGADEAVLSLDRNGKAGTWLLSAYEKYPDLKSARLSEVAEERMPDGKYFTKDDLHRSLTSRGLLGQVIASMIDAGVVKLHGGPGKLPGKARGVKGVQAVTMPDGTIHMVASNLTPRTAFPVLMHEMFHQGGEKLIGTKEWGNLMGRLGSLYRQSEQSGGKAREFYDRARSRVDAARRKGAVGKAMEVEEFAAYAIEEYEKSPDSLPGVIRKWVEDLIGLVKTWAVQRFGKQLGQVTPGQLAAMARLALLDVAAERRGEIFGEFAERFSADSGDNAARKQNNGGLNGAGLAVEELGSEDFARYFGKEAQAAGSRVPGAQEPATVSGRAPRVGWAESTSIRRTDGKPAVVYRGAGRGLGVADFGASALGHATNNPSSGLGVWFAHNQEDAERYGDVEDFHLDIRNPAIFRNSDLPGFDSLADAQAFARRLQAKGYDGIVVDYRNVGGPVHFVAFNPDTVIHPADPGKQAPRYSIDHDEDSRAEETPSKLTPDQVAKALDTSRWLDLGLKLGKAQKVYRGTSDRTGRNTANFGRGLYTTTDKKEAAQYGAVSEMDRDVLPKNPIRFSDEGRFREWESFVAREIFGYRRLGDFEAEHGIPDQWVRELDPAIDGIQIGTGHGTFFVTFPTIKESLNVDGPRYSVAPDEESRAEPVELTPPEQGTLRSFQAAVQDSQNRVKQVQDRITKLAGREIGEKADYYLAETNRPGRIAARLEDAQNHLFQPLMKRLAKSGHTMEELTDLLHAQHAEERNAAVARINDEHADTEKKPGSGMADSVAQDIKRQYEGDAELQALAQQARDIARATLDLKLAYGLLKKEDYDLLTGMYENYVPLKGDGEYGPKIKRAMGHGAREEHILENIARDYQQAVVVGEKNLARQSLLRLVLQNPDPSLWTVGVPPKGRYVAGKVYAIFKGSEKVASFTSAAQVQAFLEDRGANAGYTVRDSAGEQVKEFAKPLQDNEVMVYVKGDPVRIQIGDEKLARQLRPIIENRDLTRWFIEKMRALNRFKAAIYTGRNPAFIPRNMARDAMTGTINMTGHHGAQVAAKAWAKYPAAFKAMFQYAASGKVPAGELGGYMTEYRQHGGKVGASYMSDLEQQGKTLTRMFDDAYGAGGFLRDGRTGKAAWVGSRKLIGGLAHGIEIINQAAENALRQALYATLREGGATPAKAAQAAKTVTVDFDRKGEATGVLGALYLFINPAIQGTANMVRTMATGEHKAQAWALVGALTLAGMLTAGANMDDDKERWLGEEWDARTKNYIRYFGNKKVSIPLSQEYSPFYAAGAAIAEARRGESAMKSSLRLFSSFLDAYFPLQGAFHPDSDNHAADLAMATVPTAIRPHVETAFNRNSFGSQIVPENEQTKNRPDNLKMNRSTKGTVYDKAAQSIASAGELLGAGKYENDITKVSPETLKHLWRTYTGGLGQFVTDSAGLVALAGEDPSQVESSDLPIVKDFVKPQDVKPLRGRYYDLAKEAKAAQEEFRQAKKVGDAEAMDKILGDERKAELLSLAKTVTTTNKAAAELADEKVDVLADDSLSTAKKRERLKEIEKEEEALYRDAIDAFK